MKLISKISIVISIIGICIAISIQYNLFLGYQNATGKTRALYGIKHLMQIDYISVSYTHLTLPTIYSV